MACLPPHRCFIAVLALLCVTSCRSATDPSAAGSSRRAHTASGVALGATFRITVFAADQRTAQAATAAAFERLADLDRTLNCDRADSEISALNAAAGGPAVKVSDDLYAVLRHAQRLATTHRGAFDVTAGPYIDLRRRAALEGRVPTPAELEQARLLVGSDKLRLDSIERTAVLTVPRRRLDTAGIARGYAADQMMQQLRLHGCERSKVDAGNVVLLGSPPPGAAGWPVTLHGLSLPRGERTRDFNETAVAFWPGPTRSEGNRRGDGAVVPLIDPASGRAVPTPVPVVVIGRGAAIAESVAACAAVTGPRGAEVLARTEWNARVHFGTRKQRSESTRR